MLVCTVGPMRLFWDSLGGDKLLSLDQWTPLQCLPPSVLPLSQPNLQATIIMSLVPIASGPASATH